ncbi:MAG TPA: LON peptidase substrate-binding domain-containing protein [Steroidobacteraceae bacterium]|nr:LON peptidase substrate-binding domain-containing protein [Steroidobacteraceae bacterium]
MDDIALFPLNTVLFPGGLLPLRIFESRYVDMVGGCMRQDAMFGVVLIVDGNDTSAVVNIAEVGTAARIVDFQTQPDGLLGLLCRGERRFRVQQRRQQADGLNRATIEWMQDAPLTPLDPQFQPLVSVLRKVMARLASIGRFIEPNYEDASWVSHRLAEFLPLEAPWQQRLLEIDDPNVRLGMLAPLIETGRV